jgi:UDP:flavonoid glycosyltransferase YjiC (YdhE family)
MAPPWSGVVARYGAGDRLDHQLMSVSELRDRIERVLNGPSFREGAAALREAWAARPSPNDIVPTLEKLTAEHRPG